MHLYVMKHADPDFNRDTISEYGRRQAEALASKLCYIQMDEIYSSPSKIAQDTAKPLSEKLGLPINIIPWAAETEKTTYPSDYNFQEEVAARQENNWYTHENFSGELTTGFDQLLEVHGYLREGDLYKVVDGNDKKIAIFCSDGVGAAIFARCWNVPVKIMREAAEMSAAGITHFWLQNYEAGYTSPRCLYLNDTTHLHKANLIKKA